VNLRIFTRFLAALCVALAPAAAAAQTAMPGETVTRLAFLHFNDAYKISPEAGLGGFAGMATLLKRERSRHAHHFTTFGGDLISPSLLSGVTKGAHMIELMNAIGIDVAVLGNHEFDHGPDVLRQRIAESRFPWLAANALGPDGKPFGGAGSIHVAKAGPHTVGFFGLITPEARIYIRGGMPVRFGGYVEHARAAVAELRRQGADIIVAVTHMDVNEDMDLARKVLGIHLILGGHEHHPIAVYQGGTLIVKAGQDAQFLGVVELLAIKAENRLRVVPDWRLMPNFRVPPDADVEAIVKRWEDKLAAELGEPIGTTETPLDSRSDTVRSREAAIGNLIADAQRAAMGADAALMNGGGIRAGRLYAAGTVLTRRDVLGELPFGNIVMVLEATGAELKAAIEHGLSEIEGPSGRFPHVSGMAVTFDPKRPVGARVVSLTVGGEALDPARRYRLAVNDFLASGGDGYAALVPLRRIVDSIGGPNLTTVVIEYVKGRGRVAPRVEGRMKPL
jgi:5'-nucleotidase / UDP-sugar diphosphatase